MQHETNRTRPEMEQMAEIFRKDKVFKQAVLDLKDLFINKTDALLHADLHTGSIMANEQDTYVIDPEFAYVGPFGFDVGALIANLVISWASHFERSKDNDYQAWLLSFIQEFLETVRIKILELMDSTPSQSLDSQGYLSEADFIDYQRHYMRKILQESVGFAGCKIARRIFGVAPVADVRGIQDPDATTRVEKLLLQIAREFVTQYPYYKSAEDILTTLHTFATPYEHDQRKNHPCMQTFTQQEPAGCC